MDYGWFRFPCPALAPGAASLGSPLSSTSWLPTSSACLSLPFEGSTLLCVLSSLTDPKRIVDFSVGSAFYILKAAKRFPEWLQQFTGSFPPILYKWSRFSTTSLLLIATEFIVYTFNLAILVNERHCEFWCVLDIFISLKIFLSFFSGIQFSSLKSILFLSGLDFLLYL